MNLNLNRLLILSVAVFAILLGANKRASGHDVAKEMADAANVFLKSLDSGQTAAVQFQFEDPLRKDWQFIPMERKGLGLKSMKPHQRGLAMGLVQSALSHRGFETTMQIMALEQVLHELENNSMKRDPTKYHVFLFGDPSTEATWGWRIEGHHLSITVTLVDGKTAIIAPSFLGANPATVKTGSFEGVRALGDIEDLGRQLVTSLSDDQKSVAVLPGKAPRDVINGPGRTAEDLEPAGIAAGNLDDSQQQTLNQLIDAYLGRFRTELAKVDREKIDAAGADKLQFAWAGKTQAGKPHYFRVQGPTFIFEYDNTQNGANHVHAVWRDFKDDFGEDALRKHYQSVDHGSDNSQPETTDAVEK